MTTAAIPAQAKRTTSDVRQLLRNRYPSARSRPRWATFEEVRNAGGFDATRSCDFMAFGLWPSDGYSLHGHEIKVDRADWLRELKQPDKADEMMAVCDHWWLVTATRDIARPEEVPESWGLLVPRGDRLVVAKPAPRLSPLPLDKGILSSLLRRAMETQPSERELAEARRDGHADGVREAEWQARRATEDLEGLQEAVDQFERTSGVRISSYNGPDIGRAVALLRNSHLASLASNVSSIAQRLDNLARAAEKDAEHVRSLLATESNLEVV